MKVEENEGNPSEVVAAPETSVVETPQHDSGGGDESTLAALAGLGGEALYQQIEDSRKANAPEIDAPAEVVPEIEKPDPEDVEATSKNVLKDVIASKVVNEIKEEVKNTDEGVEKPEGGIPEIKTELETINSPIFGGKKPVGNIEVVSSTLEFDGSDIANKFIKEKTGHENLESLVTGSLNLQEKASNYDAAKKEVDGYSEFFKNMPAELYEAVNSYHQGNDWKAEILNRPNLDFAKKVEDHSDHKLVENYMPNEFSKEDWEEYKGDDCDLNLKRSIDLAVKTSKSNYANDRSEIEGLQVTRATQAESKSKAFNDSVNSSIDYLKKNVEGIDAGYVDNLQKNLNINMLTEMFLNQDGTLKEDAALKVVMATDGHSMVEQYKVIAERRIENKERQEVLLRTPDKIKAKKGSAEVPGKLNPELQKTLDNLNTGFEQQAVY